MALIISGYIASGKLRTRGYAGLFDFIKTIGLNYLDGFKAKPEEISIEIGDKNFNKLKKKRKQALERGIIINDLDGDYVPATLSYKGKKMKVKLRLKGHMTDHLQENKWSFRIKVADKNADFMGMKRFSIQHPGTRGYIYEWIYHRLMQREGIIALRYKFINVILNGRNWGIYAVEENFENELLVNNGRKPGPILRYNPDLYWVNRYNVFTNTGSVDEFASYYSANPEAYRDDKLLKDSIQRRNYLTALALFESLRSGKISVAEAFDIEKLAKFHAIIDLVGGIHSIDWSDVKYYYNSETGKLEPVAYESFTNLLWHDITSQYKFQEKDSAGLFKDWHAMIFSDPVFFTEYMLQLKRMSDADYMDKFFSEEENELKENLSVINKEFPYKKFEKGEYYMRQLQIKKVLNPPKAVHAYYKKIQDSKLILQVACIDALPVEIHFLRSANITIKPGQRIIMASKQEGALMNFKEFEFKIPAGININQLFIDSLKIVYSILGSSELKSVKVFPYPHTDHEFLKDENSNKKSTVAAFDFIEKAAPDVYVIKEGKYSVDKDLIVPDNCVMIIAPGAELNFIKGSGFFCYSSLSVMGNEAALIKFKSEDKSWKGMLISSSQKTVFEYVVFDDLPAHPGINEKAAISCYDSDVEFKNCCFIDAKSEDVIDLVRCRFLFAGNLFKNASNDAIDIDYSEGKVMNTVFENCKENALDIMYSKVSLNSVFAANVGNKAINAKEGAQITADSIQVADSFIGISAEDYSSINARVINIRNSKMGMVSYRNKPKALGASIKVNDFQVANVTMPYAKDEFSELVIDKKSVKEPTSKLESLIKHGKKI